MAGSQVVIASNRGPVSFARNEEGRLVPKKGVGGLVTALTGALQLSGGLWIASAMSDEDREAAATGRVEVAAGEARYSLRYLAFDHDTYDRFYNAVSNRILWFLHHSLWDIPRTPTFGPETRRAWNAYREVNDAFAAALDEEGAALSERPVYLVQDYHLSLVPAILRKRQPDAPIAHFSHVPFAGPGYLEVLPSWMREELLAGVLGADVLGFQALAWAERFLLGCRGLAGARVDLRRRTVRWEGREVRVRVYPISIAAEDLQTAARSEEVVRRLHDVARVQGDARLIVRVDRTELSKNILRGFLAYEQFLLRRPEWRRRAVFLALLNPSRQDLPEYQSYLRECLSTADRINDELGDEAWRPLVVQVKDDLPMTLAAYTRYDVLMVNPVFDGMNLVAKEGPVVNERNGILVLSENAGAFEELGRHSLAVNPFDVDATAEALAEALEMDEKDRARRASALRKAILGNRLDRWVGRQLKDLEAAGSRSQG